MEKEGRKTKKIFIIVPVIALAILAILPVMRFNYVSTCYRAIDAVESLELPDDLEIVYPLKAEISDIYYPHVRAEMVVRCERGEDYVSKYIEDNNSSLKKGHIKARSLAGMSDMAMYDFDMMPEEDQQKILADGVDNYINITYERKILWAPVSWYTAEPVQK